VLILPQLVTVSLSTRKSGKLNANRSSPLCLPLRISSSVWTMSRAGLSLRQLILERKGYLVSTARTASEALAIFKAKDFDTVVTDHLLGRATGISMAKEMKRLKPQVPIILLSGTADTPEDIEIVDAFLSKAEGPESLLAKVQELVVGCRTRASSVAALPKDEMLSSAQSETLQLLAAIVESSDDAIFSKTLDGTITTWNRAAEKMYGYSTQEMIGKSVFDLQPSDRPGDVPDILERLKKGEKVDHFETTRIAKDGHLLTVSLTISPIKNGEGKIIGASTIAHEITRTELAEQTLRNSESWLSPGAWQRPLHTKSIIRWKLSPTPFIYWQSRPAWTTAHVNSSRLPKPN
jgi:PAS domain S-box-containing protein